MWHSGTVPRIIWTWMWSRVPKSIALGLLPWVEQPSDLGHVRMALCGGEQKSLCVRVRIAPAAQEERHANVPAPLPRPPWCVHSCCECICARIWGAVEAVLYLLTQKRDMRAMTWKSGLTRWMFCCLFVCLFFTLSAPLKKDDYVLQELR